MAFKCIRICLVFMCILSLLTSCNMALGTPKAGTLLSFLCKDFTCGFSIMENETSMAAASYMRKVGCDTFTYEKNGQRVTFRFENGEDYLLTGTNEKESALVLPVKLSKEHGAKRICEIFSCFPTDDTESGTWSVTRVADTYRLETCERDDLLVWIFSAEMVPLSVTYGDTTLTFTSFSRDT